jgi:hypothetical protein
VVFDAQLTGIVAYDEQAARIGACGDDGGPHLTLFSDLGHASGARLFCFLHACR